MAFLDRDYPPPVSYFKGNGFEMMSLHSLAKAASIGGVLVIGSAYYFKNRIQDGLRSSEYYKESLRILREHRGIAHLMGEPIREGKLDLGDNENNFCTGTVAQFQTINYKRTCTIRFISFDHTPYEWASSHPDTDFIFCVVKWYLQHQQIKIQII
ncbi:uncharacterized protein LOC135220601 [Macrobrachium nipponense]|uniref:uncharacterized protein LOC135220601 n=1 Tax=Macrobrachium nipponense TaxID=159736 RepID=UPI0030C85B0E